MRYTAVFEWEDGKEPVIGRRYDWLGGTLISVQFDDALAKLDELTERLEALEDCMDNETTKPTQTDSYIQRVPDQCDRIIWRNQSIHLPIMPNAMFRRPLPRTDD